MYCPLFTTMKCSKSGATDPVAEKNNALEITHTQGNRYPLLGRTGIYTVKLATKSTSTINKGRVAIILSTALESKTSRAHSSMALNSSLHGIASYSDPGMQTER